MHCEFTHPDINRPTPSSPKPNPNKTTPPQVTDASKALPASTSITLAVFMAFVALVLLAVGFLVGCVRLHMHMHMH